MINELLRNRAQLFVELSTRQETDSQQRIGSGTRTAESVSVLEDLLRTWASTTTLHSANALT